MFTLETTQTIRAVAGTATAVTYTIFGDEVGASADTFKVLAQGQLASSVGTIYTVPGSTSTLVKSIRLANTTASTVSGIKFYVGGTAAANQITGTFDIPANGTATLAGEGIEVRDSAGALVYAGIVPSTRQVIAGSALTGGGALTADVTLDVGVDGSTIEVNADALRVKDAGITGAKIASSVALAGSPTTTTQAASDNSTKIATTAYVDTADALKAPLASPALTGNPTAPTQTAGNNSTRIATTAYADNAATTAASGAVVDSIADADTTHAPSRNAVFDALALKADLASPTFTGTVGGITKSMVGLGNVDNTSDATKNSATATLTNKRITKRVDSTASTATYTFDWDSFDSAKITAQAAALSIANPTGTPTSMQGFILRIKDNGTARAITYGTQFRAIGVTLPTTTVISKTTYLGCIWNSDDSKVDVIAVAQEA